MTESSRTRDEMDAEVAALPPLAVRLNESAAYRDLFAGLTPDEVRVITGLVRAMREHRLPLREPTPFWSLRAAEECLRAGSDACLRQSWSDATFTAAWHIAHAISMAGDEDASRVLGERGR